MFSTIFYPALKFHLAVAIFLFATPFKIIQDNSQSRRMTTTTSSGRIFFFRLQLLFHAAYVYNMLAYIFLSKDPFPRKAQVLGMVIAIFGLHLLNWNWNLEHSPAQFWNSMVHWEDKFGKGTRT